MAPALVSLLVATFVKAYIILLITLASGQNRRQHVLPLAHIRACQSGALPMIAPRATQLPTARAHAPRGRAANGFAPRGTRRTRACCRYRASRRSSTQRA